MKEKEEEKKHKYKIVRNVNEMKNERKKTEIIEKMITYWICRYDVSFIRKNNEVKKNLR